MNQQYGVGQDEVIVVGFDVPISPEESYNNPNEEEEGRDPPKLPPQLQHALLGQLQNVTLNHLYMEKREAPRSVVGLGLTHRFRSKFVTVVLYKPFNFN